MADLSRINPTGFYAVNLGNGKTIQLSWGVADIHAVKHFVIQRYDVYEKKWVPYDGFHGLITKEDGDGSIPPQQTTIEVDESGDHSFRIKVVGKDNAQTEWISTTITVSINENFESSNVYFVQTGLAVTHNSGRTFDISAGTAYIAGSRVTLASATQVTVGSGNNTTYLIYIDADGSVSSIESNETPEGTIRLAEAHYDAGGSLNLVDTRFLWAPTNLTVQWDEENRFVLTMKVSWDAIDEHNLAGYLLYRGTNALNLNAIATIDRNTTEFLDNNGLINGRTYYYAIGAIDWGNNRSPRTDPPVEAEAGDTIPPSEPIGLNAFTEINEVDGTYVQLSWTPNGESDLEGYHVYDYSNDETTYTRIATISRKNDGSIDNSIRIPHLTNGKQYKFAVSAFDFMGNESTHSNILAVTVGDTTKPKAPTWASTPFKVGGNELEVWVDLFWNKVTQNADDTAISDLEGYKIYQRLPDGAGYKYRFIVDINDGDILEDRIRWDASYRGDTFEFVVTAYDKWQNESAYSTAQTVVLGGIKPQAPNFTLESLTDTGIDKVKISWPRVTLDENNEATIVEKYIIYKGTNALQVFQEAVVIDDISATPATTLEWIDSGVERGETYHYTVVAMDTIGTKSDVPVVQSILVGDFNAPNAPTITSSGTEVSGTDINNFIEFQMPADDDIKGVAIYYSSNDGTYQQIGWVVNDDSPSYRWDHTNDIINGKTYHYALTTVDQSENETSIANAAKVSILAGDITKPGSPVVTATGMWVSGEPIVRLSWPQVTQTDEATPQALTNKAGYRIYRSINGTTFRLHAEIEETDDLPDPFTYDDKEVANGTRYWYRVTCYNTLGVESVYGSDDIEAGDITGPAAPTNVQINFVMENPTSAKVTVSWDAPGDADVDKYEVWKSLNGGDYSLLYELDDNTTQIDDNAIYGQHVYYNIRAVDEAGNEGAFASIDVDVLDNTTPANVALDSTTIIQQPGDFYRVTLNWTSYTPPSDFGSYSVYESPDGQTSTAVVIHTITDKDKKDYTAEGLRSGNTYYLGVTCVDEFGNESTLSLTTVEVEDTLAPNPVTNLTATPVELAIELSWDPPTTNTDGSNLIDLAGFEISVSDDGSIWSALDTVISNTYRHAVGGNVTKHYRVRAYDNAAVTNYSTYVTVGPVTSLGLDYDSFDTTPPSDVQNLRAAATPSGTDISSDDDTENVWIEFEWDANPPADKVDYYNIYIDGQYHSQTKATSYRVNGLYNKGSYDVQVTAVDKTRNESEKQATPLTINVAKYTATLTGPTPVEVKQYFRGFVLRWNKANARHVAGYDLEYYESNDGVFPATPDSVNWNPVGERANVTFALHGRLDYDKYYFYRIRTVDTFDNTSEWVYFDDFDLDGLQAAKTGNEDLLANSIYGLNIFGQTIEGLHIKGRTLTGDHLSFNTLVGDHIQSNEVVARHLKIETGGRNHVKNSAFGMRDLDNNLGINWDISDPAKAYIIDTSTDSQIPINDHALEITSLVQDTVSATQYLDIPESATQVTVSFYVYSDSISDNGGDDAFIVDLWDADAATPYRFQSDDATPIDQYIKVSGNTSWTRYKKRFYLHPDRNSVQLRLILNNSDGTVRVTGVQVEEGDIDTKWSPRDGETYGALGEVQINDEGIRVTNGRILVETAHGAGSKKVVINADGVLAGDGNVYAKMDANGFTSVGGGFSVTTAANLNDASSISFDSDSIRAYDSGGIERVKIDTTGMLTVTGGKFSLVSSDTATDRLELDSSGLRLKSGGDTKVNINTTDGISIKNKFTIQSDSLSQNGFEITEQHIKAFDGSGETTFFLKSSDGSIVAGSPFTISSAGLNSDGTPKKTGERIVFRTAQWHDDAATPNTRPGGIYGYNSGSTNDYDEDYMAFRLLNNGEAHFNNSIHIYSASNTNQVTITPSGIFGNGFSLTDGVGGGLTVTNATITQGNITMNSNGLTVDGANGIHIKNGSTTIVDITNSGIDVQQGAGIKVTGGGSITFGGSNTTAIDTTGIKAPAITSGTLKVQATDGAASIEVWDGGTKNVDITPTGINIFNGTLNVYSDDGSSTLIQNGMVQASALNIGVSGSNLIKNGRADYSITASNWTTTGTVSSKIATIAENGSDAGISGEYAFKLSGASSMTQPISTARNGRKYTAIWSVYVASGSGAVGLEVVAGTGDIVDIPVGSGSSYAIGQWHTIRHTFTAGASTPSIYVNADAVSNVVYVTDVMVIEGDMVHGYSPHPSEVMSDRVTITDGEIKILSASDNSIVIDNTGIVKGTDFALTSSGLSINLATKSIDINDTVGIKVTGVGGEHVTIDETGITTDGMFSLTGSSGRVIINDEGVRILPPDLVSADIIEIGKLSGTSVFGMRIKTGDGATTVIDENGINAEAIYTGNLTVTNNLKIIASGASGYVDITPSGVFARNSSGVAQAGFNVDGYFMAGGGNIVADAQGLRATKDGVTTFEIEEDGSVHIRGSNPNSYAEILEDRIEIVDGDYSTVLSPFGIVFQKKDGNGDIIKESLYFRDSISGEANDGDTVTLDDFAVEPSITMSPIELPTYSPSYDSEIQKIIVKPNKVRYEGEKWKFDVVCRLVAGDMNNPLSVNQTYGVGQVWTSPESSPTLESTTTIGTKVSIQWHYGYPAFPGGVTFTIKYTIGIKRVEDSTWTEEEQFTITRSYDAPWVGGSATKTIKNLIHTYDVAQGNWQIRARLDSITPNNDKYGIDSRSLTVEEWSHTSDTLIYGGRVFYTAFDGGQ